MNTMSTIFRAIKRAFEVLAMTRVQSTLLSMGPEWVERHGYSYELLSGGVKNWPWRQASEGQEKENEPGRVISELKRPGDGELADPGVAESGIESAMRYDHSKEYIELNQQDTAA